MSRKQHWLEHSDSRSSTDPCSDSEGGASARPPSEIPQKSLAKASPFGASQDKPPAAAASQLGFFDTLEWQEGNQQMIDSDSSNDEVVNDNFDDEFAEFSANRTSGTKAESSRITQPKPAQLGGLFDDIAGDQSENNLFEAQFTETSSESNWRGIVDTTDDLLGGAEWSAEPVESVAGGVTLLDIGESEPSNFNLLVGEMRGSNVDLFGGENQNPFLGADDPVPASNQNQFDLFSSSALDDNIPQDSSSSLLFDSFIPFQRAVPTPVAAQSSKSSEKTVFSPQNQMKSPEDDFLTFLESKPTSQQQETSDDLLGQWNASNITSAGPGIGVMPRPTSRPDLIAGQVPRNNSSTGVENLYGQTGQKMDPFGDLG